METTAPKDLNVLTTRTRMKVLDALNVSAVKASEERAKEKMDLHRSKVLVEIIATEKSYLKHLNIINKASALQEVSCVAVLINNCIQDHENMQKMLAIQRSLAGSQPKIVIPGRKFIKGGPLMKVSRKGDTSHRRVFFLFTDMLMYCKQRGADYSGSNSLSCCCVFPIKHCRIETLFDCGQKIGTLMKLTCKDENLLLYTDDAVYGESWVDALRSTLRQFSEFRQTLRKESSAKRPLRRAALLKQKEESLSKLKQKRKLEEAEQVECSNRADAEAASAQAVKRKEGDTN